MKSFGIKKWALQFDNYPKHKSSKAKKYLKNQNIKNGWLTLYSPHLSSFKNVWFNDFKFKKKKCTKVVRVDGWSWNVIG